jgi:hypothetical protein
MLAGRIQCRLRAWEEKKPASQGWPCWASMHPWTSHSSVSKYKQQAPELQQSLQWPIVLLCQFAPAQQTRDAQQQLGVFMLSLTFCPLLSCPPDL